MAKLTAEKVFENAHISLVNTRQARFRDVHPQIKTYKDKLLLVLGDKKLSLSFLDEVILHLITTFRYAPVWLVLNWLSVSKNTQDSARLHIRSLIDFGLLYEYPTAIGVFLMPTNLSANLFSIQLGKFRDPSYNILTHEVSEMDILFKLILGQLSFKCETQPFPYVSQFFKTQCGSQALTEHDFNKSLNFFKGSGKCVKTDEVAHTINALIGEMRAGKQITTFDIKQKQLAIYKKNKKGSFDVKVPDIAVLAPRKIKEGIARPQSIALEVELVPKRIDAYVRALSLYWDNLIYGKVIYLVTNSNTLKNIQTAYNKLNKVKQATCKFEIINYEIPYNTNDLL